MQLCTAYTFHMCFRTGCGFQLFLAYHTLIFVHVLIIACQNVPLETILIIEVHITNGTSIWFNFHMLVDMTIIASFFQKKFCPHIPQRKGELFECTMILCLRMLCLVLNADEQISHKSFESSCIDLTCYRSSYESLNGFEHVLHNILRFSRTRLECLNMFPAKLQVYLHSLHCRWRSFFLTFRN